MADDIFASDVPANVGDGLWWGVSGVGRRSQNARAVGLSGSSLLLVHQRVRTGIFLLVLKNKELWRPARAVTDRQGEIVSG